MTKTKRRKKRKNNKERSKGTREGRKAKKRTERTSALARMQMHFTSFLFPSQKYRQLFYMRREMPHLP